MSALVVGVEVLVERAKRLGICAWVVVVVVEQPELFRYTMPTTWAGLKL